MSFSATRLTVYALLTSLEESLKQTIQVHLVEQSMQLSLGPDRVAKASDRLMRDRGSPEGGTLEAELLDYLDFSELWEVLNSNRSKLPKSLGVAFQQLTPQLQNLVPIRNRVAHSRPVEFDDLAVTLDVVRHVSSEVPDDCFQPLRSTLSRLERDPSFVLGLEIPQFDADQKSHNLPTPDFDETGFIGRRAQVESIIRLILGPYPVITLVAEGGAGKTAVALKVAYEMLDHPDSPFDAIVWSTAKTTQLTPSEILRIEGAISDSLGLFQSVATHLAGPVVGDPMAEVLAYLTEFKILLIIDNLETVLDDRIRTFLESLPSGSKILITSRIGLGAFEYPVKLKPLETQDSIRLLRALAKSRNAEGLVSVPNPVLERYVKRLNNSPGFIKWFVSVVQAGRRPEEAFNKPDLFLDFCMSNVHEYLEESSRKVLRSMLCVQGPHSQAELSFLNRVDASQLQEALHQLLTTNMVVMTSTASGSTFESKYELAELARSYLLKHHPISDQEHQEFTRMLKVLTAATDSIRREQSLDPYSWNSIATRSQSDLIVAKYLTDAMRSAGRNQKEALNLVTKAKALAPEYFEVHRVEALIEAWSGNIAAARSAYEKAIELEPQSAPLRVWFGRFVIKSLQDPESALEQFEFAQQIDPTAFDVQLELARANVWLKRFEEAESIVSALLSRSDTGVRKQKKVFDVALQMHLKNAEALMLEFQLEGALEILEELKQTYLDCPEPLHDAQMRDKLSRSITIGRKCLARIVDPFLKSKAEEYLDWLMTELEGGNHEKVPTTRKAKS